MLDHQDLLKPISPESRVGIYLKSDRSVYRNLRNMFNAAQSSFRRLIETPDSSEDETLFEENQNNWQQLSDTCWQTLTQTSKDIEVYCWWLMSLAFQRDSISQIASGLETLVPFVDSFWPDVHPRLPDDKLKTSSAEEQAKEIAELQLRPFIQLVGESNNSGLLYMPLQMLLLIGDIDHSAYLSATKSGKLPALKAKAQQAFSGVKNETSSTIKALGLALSSVEQLDLWLGKKCGDLGVPLISCRFLKGNINDCLEAIKFLVGSNYAVWPLAGDPTDNQNDTAVAVAKNANPLEQSPEAVIRTGSVATQRALIMANEQGFNRDQAFLELRKLANYFHKAEPHSPVSFLLEKAIRWGYMSLPELMQELVAGNDKVLNQIAVVTGMDGEKADLPEVHSEVSPDRNSAAAPTPVATEAKVATPPAPVKDSGEKPAVKQEIKENEVSTTKQETAADSGFDW